MLPLVMPKPFFSQVSFSGITLHTNLTVLKVDKVCILMSEGQASPHFDIFHQRQIEQRKLSFGLRECRQAHYHSKTVLLGIL